MFDDIVFGTEGEVSDVLGAALGDDENVVLPVATSPGFSFRYANHGFHGDDHAWFQLGLHVFS